MPPAFAVCGNRSVSRSLELIGLSPSISTSFLLFSLQLSETEFSISQAFTKALCEPCFFAIDGRSKQHRWRDNLLLIRDGSIHLLATLSVEAFSVALIVMFGIRLPYHQALQVDAENPLSSRPFWANPNSVQILL